MAALIAYFVAERLQVSSVFTLRRLLTPSHGPIPIGMRLLRVIFAVGMQPERLAGRLSSLEGVVSGAPGICAVHNCYVVYTDNSARPS